MTTAELPQAAAPEQIADHVMALFKARGNLAYGEDVTEREHGVQCAALARRDGHDDELIAAALMHDIGHLLHDAGEDVAERGVDMKHEDLGAVWLARHFRPQVVEPVRHHVAAKRYLCATQPGYRAALSPASEQSLVLQGGEMSPAEIIEFEAHPHYERLVTVRRYDDMGKDTELSGLSPESFRDAVVSAARLARG